MTAGKSSTPVCRRKETRTEGASMSLYSQLGCWAAPFRDCSTAWPELVVCKLHGHLRGVDRVAFQREQRGVALLLQPQPPIAAGEGEVGRGAGCLLQLIQREGGIGKILQRPVDGRAGLFCQAVGGGVGVGHFVDKPDGRGILQH